MKELVGAFNQEKALVGAFSVIVKTGCGTDGALHSTIPDEAEHAQDVDAHHQHRLERRVSVNKCSSSETFLQNKLFSLSPSPALCYKMCWSIVKLIE